ncbi:YoaK family protein [Methylobacterium flocculans]|uniref:YoaK family protein n=1 Tax=Methylobacterium flocculans TaxID=2984843 RepID=UPI0021F2BA87|nr:YoaK family protein [Methylobacterium sp. FF17]
MTRPWHLGFGLVLTALAGYVDALGFIRLGGLYTSFMSGNTTQFAVSLGHGDPHHALLPGLLILAFLLGGLCGGGLSALTPSRWVTPVILGFETAVVSAAFQAATAAPESGVASLMLALAMGAQNAVLSHVQGFRAGTTFVTGALFGFGQKLALALARRGARWAWVGDGVVWLALLVGSLAGTVAYGRLALYALAIPAGIAGFLALVATILTARATPKALAAKGAAT